MAELVSTRKSGTTENENGDTIRTKVQIGGMNKMLLKTIPKVKLYMKR
jgi:hypothetical protein